MTDDLQTRLSQLRNRLYGPGETVVKLGGVDSVIETLLDAIDQLEAEIVQLRADAGL